MTVQIVRFTSSEDDAPAIERAVAATVDALDDAAPAGVGYRAFEFEDGVTFILLLELADGAENPLPSLPAARALQQTIAAAATERPAPQTVTVIGSYGRLAASTASAAS